MKERETMISDLMMNTRPCLLEQFMKWLSDRSWRVMKDFDDDKSLADSDNSSEMSFSGHFLDHLVKRNFVIMIFIG
jgi:hypothetical protein